jgi:hypothetical protein
MVEVGGENEWALARCLESNQEIAEPITFALEAMLGANAIGLSPNGEFVIGHGRMAHEPPRQNGNQVTDHVKQL